MEVIPMGDTMHTILTRRSCRAYRPDPVPQEALEAVLKAGVYAPTGMGKQSPIILAVTNKETRDQLSALNAKIMGQGEGFDPFYGAPVVLVVLADKAVPTHVYDGSLVMANLMLAAHDQGLGSCWIHRAKEEFESPEGKALLQSLGIQGDYEGIGHCVLGYAAMDPAEAAPRKEPYVYYVK
jgi:nitroreductase